MFYPQVTAGISAKVGLWEELETLAEEGKGDQLVSALAGLPGAEVEASADFAALLAAGRWPLASRRLPSVGFPWTPSQVLFEQRCLIVCRL